MGICCGFVRLSDRNIDAMIRHPHLVYSFLGFEAEPPRATGGLLARLIGRTSSPPPPAETESLPGPREDDDANDVDKAWQAIQSLPSAAAGDEGRHSSS